MATLNEWTDYKNPSGRANLWIIGDGAHSRDIQANIEDWRKWAYPRVLHHHSELTDSMRLPYAHYIIAINDPQTRARVAEELGVNDSEWTHADARLWGTDIGAGTHINYGVTMTRTTIGHHCTISPGVTICGDVTIGDRTLVGAGATICDRVTIGNDVTIGAGAVVLPETIIPDGETWLGVPARVQH